MVTQIKNLPTDRSLLAYTGEPFIHRDLSWLQFNERVLDEAKDPTTPLFERTKFLSITSSNLDEFFMIRFASLNRSIQAQVRRGQYDRAKQGKRIRGQIIDQVRKMTAEQDAVLGSLAKELSKRGARILTGGQPVPDAAELGKKIFDEQVLPLIERDRPRKIENLIEMLSLQLAAVFPAGGICYPLSKSIPAAFVARDEALGQSYLFFLDHLLLAYLGPALGIQSPCGVIRLTRDGDVTVELDHEEDPESVPDVVSKQLRRRDVGRAVRLQTVGDVSPEVSEAVRAALKIDEELVFRVPHTLCLHGLWSIRHALAESMSSDPSLVYPPLTPIMPPEFDGKRPIVEILKERDILLHHPYDSFDAFVAWIREACKDKEVTGIELTVYRTDSVSPVVDALKKAAKTRKIRVVIELRARFDELNNLKLAE